ncbi:MAG: CHC2 zinc finger domain-containing protein [Desulfobacterales bacterium]|jgi:hypothetical protein|nr:CHC2 zinc finger domain-containing protein [Desulfobacterales bacterium]
MDILTAVQSKVQLRPNGKRHGAEFVGPCPFCKDGNDRFHVWPSHPKWKGGGWWCRFCGKSGDLIAFFMQADGLSYKQACQEAGIEGREYGYTKPILHSNTAQKAVFTPTAYDAPADLWSEKAAVFVNQAHDALMSNPPALDKLHRERGITADGARRFRLGINGKDFYRPRESWGLPTEIVEKTGKPKKLWIPRGLVIPYLVDGPVYRIRIRRPKVDVQSNNGPRYYFVPGSSPAIMLIGKRQRAYMVVESELDGILIGQDAGDLTGVVALGTSASKPDSRCAADISAAAVLLVSLDSDAAGEKASGWWLDNFIQADRWPVPDGKDPGDVFRSVDVRSWVLAGLPPAWHINETPPADGPKPLLPEKAVVKESAPKPQPQKPAFPETVMELGELLKQHPVRIYSTPKRLKLEWPPSWRNEVASKRISKLVYFDENVSRFIGRHPKERIDGRNFFLRV